MTIKSSSLSKSFVTVQDNKPQTPFEGQIWVDTSSGNTTKQYKNGSFEKVSKSLDPLYNIIGEIAGFLEVVDLDLTLNDWNHDDGFIELHQDQTGISSSNNVDITTGTPSGNISAVKKGIKDDLESGSSELNLESNSNVSIDTNSEINGTNSLKINSSDQFVDLERDLNSPINEDGAVWSTQVKIDNQTGADNEECAFNLQQDDNFTIGTIQFEHNGDINVGGSDYSTWTTGTVYKLEVVFDFTNSNFDVKIDGSSIVTNVSFNNSSYSEMSGIRIENDTGGQNATVNLFLDDYVYTYGGADGSITYTTRTLDVVPNEVQVDGSEVNLNGNSSIEVQLSDQSGNTVNINSLDTSISTTSLSDTDIDTKVLLKLDSSGNLPDYNKLIWTGVQ